MIEASDAIVVGVDFGTLSGRIGVIRVSDGSELGGVEVPYPHGVIDATLPGRGTPLPPDWALQMPSDYIEVLAAIPRALTAARVDSQSVVGIGTDFTSCTMIPVDATLRPLCDQPRFADRPHAYVKLWKHHASVDQARRINQVASSLDPQLLVRYGGAISADWQIAKALAIFDEDREAYDAMELFMEAADWIVAILTGEVKASIAIAGYKGNFQDGQYPPREFFAALDPAFADYPETKLVAPTIRPGECAGRLSPEAAQLTGLPAGIAVAAGDIDAHVTVPAGDGCEPGQLTLIMGTSTCHMMTTEKFRPVPGVGGIVDGGIVTGLWGYEAGQAGVGDIFAWFVDHCVPSEITEAAAASGENVHEYLTERAAAQAVGEHGLVALDWHSGNRSILDDTELTGIIVGQTLATTAVDQYRALLEATAFGTRVIVEAFTQAGLAVNELVAAGGLVRNPLLLQIYSDVMNLPLSVVEVPHSGAVGSGIHAAVAAGYYPSVRDAAHVMGRRTVDAFQPNPEHAKVYDELYAEYRRLHDYFATGQTMHHLKRLRKQVLGTP